MRSYSSISDYGAIGNTRTVALVSGEGSIDWCCMPELDSPSVFAALLDARSGGHFKIRPLGFSRHEQRYLQDTNILETEFKCSEAQVKVVDFMPIDGDIRGVNSASAPPCIVRCVSGFGRSVEVEIEWKPRFNYAKEKTTIVREDGAYRAVGENTGSGALCLWTSGREFRASRDEGGDTLRAKIRVEPGVPFWLVCHFGDRLPLELRDPRHLLISTSQAWRDWLQINPEHDRRWAGSHSDLLKRSELALKLLTYQTTGSVAAAATTSLPEAIGAERNWDYRFAWVRDASMTAQALIAVGHVQEADDYLQWMKAVAERAQYEREFHVLYGLRGEIDNPERILNHLEGYKSSAPVRIGNEAGEQVQHDIFGEFIDASYELARKHSRLNISDEFIANLADQACSQWRDPDHGIWEARVPMRHYVYSKLMTWVALDRAVLMNQIFGLKGDPNKWVGERAAIFEMVVKHGYDEKRGSFVQSLHSDDLDASSLLIGLKEMLPMRDPRMQGTIDATLSGLTKDGLVMRYLSDDGLAGGEGAFLICSFWLVNALALSGRIDEAEEILESIMGRINPLGLLSEQICVHTGEYLGNYPQAFSHIGLINSLVTLNYAKGMETPFGAPLGSQEHRLSVRKNRN